MPLLSVALILKWYYTVILHVLSSNLRSLYILCCRRKVPLEGGQAHT
jgi:hypothetical protein